MGRKCCVAKCKGNYLTSSEKVRIFNFPHDSIEQGRWLRALPNRIKVRQSFAYLMLNLCLNIQFSIDVFQKVTRHIGICEKHWPTDATYSKVKRFSRPLDPPSLFPLFHPLHFIQTKGECGIFNVLYNCLYI
jgi:hypothetical protein